MSAAGEALQMLPTTVARLRICTEPTQPAASASAGKWRIDLGALLDLPHDGGGAEAQAPVGQA